MEDQITNLNTYFKRSTDMGPEEPGAEDIDIDGEYWEFKDPNEVEAWSLTMAAYRGDWIFNMKYKNCSTFIKLSLEEKVKEVTHDKYPGIFVRCVTTIPGLPEDKQYHYTLLFNSEKIPFRMAPLIESLGPTPYDGEMKELEKKIDKGDFCNEDGAPLTCKRLCTKIRNLMNSFEVLKQKHLLQESFLAGRKVSVEDPSEGVSEPSKGFKEREVQTSGNRKKREKRTSKGAPKHSHLASSSNPQVMEKASEISGPGEVSCVEFMSTVPETLRTERKPDYKAVSAVYKKYWESCTDAYILKEGEKVELSIDKLIDAPAEYNIRVKEDQIVEDMLHYLVNIPDKSTKQTLCVMPIGHKKKPESWEDVKEDHFYIINRQHSVAASKRMMEEDSGVEEETRKHFRKWNCFVVWSNNTEKLRSISAYYNRVNHFQAIQPSWATNILGARMVWVSMGSPKHPKEAAAVGTVQATKRTKESMKEATKFKAFKNAMHQRFAMIDVVKNHMMSKKKGADEQLKLVNELKIITAPEEVYNLWSEVISNAAHGELYDPDSSMKFNEKENWKQDSCSLSRDFFRPLGNLNYDDLGKLAAHLLNQSGPKRTYTYPKVTVKTISSVLDSCYSTKEWVERRKRKQMVKRELHQIDPHLGLFNANTDLIVENWREFKRSHCITSATMNVLLERPREIFFSSGKQVNARNKTIQKISPHALEFFKVFLETKKNFVEPKAVAYMRPYSILKNKHMAWPKLSWFSNTASELNLGVIDFRSIPGVLAKEKSSIEKPFFFEALTSFQKEKQPLLEEVKNWLFICADDEDQAQVLAYIEKNSFLHSYDKQFADYYPAKNERLMDLAANSAKALRKVHLLFLQRLDQLVVEKVNPEFRAPNTPMYKEARRYNEIPFRMYNMELRMEFYLWLVKTFCTPGCSVFSVFAGGKLTCAALMSNRNLYACVPDVESEIWTDIARNALKLDINDFLDNGYHVNENQFPILPQSQSAQSPVKMLMRSSTQSPTANAEKRGQKRPLHDADEEESKHDKEEDVQSGDDNECGIEFTLTPGGPSSQELPGSSTASGLPPPSATASTPITPVSRQRPEKKKKLNPMESVAQTLAYVMEQQEKMRLDQAMDREENRKRFEILTNSFFEEQRQSREMFQALLLRNQASPIASLQAPSFSTPLMIQANPSASNDSALSVPQATAALVPLPLAAAESDPPLPALQSAGVPESLPPATVPIALASAPLGTEAAPSPVLESNSGHNLQVEVEGGSQREDNVPSEDPPAGLLDMPIHSPSLPLPSIDPNLLSPTQCEISSKTPAELDQIPILETAAESPKHCAIEQNVLVEPTGSAKRQEPGPPSRHGGTAGGVDRPFRSRVSEKWINVILDLNGILCVCEDWKSKGLSHKRLKNSLQTHSSTEPALVGPKDVWVRPNCVAFLSEIEKFAFVSVWSSMKKSTTELLCEYLFRGIGGPIHILGQDSCQAVKQRDRLGRLTSFKEPGSDKDLFLKNLEILFNSSRGSFALDNTVIVDDSPLKHIANKPYNVILPDLWTYRGNGSRDTYLMDVLLPWFKNLHATREHGLKSFREHGPGKIGRRMVCDERNRREYDRLMDIVRASSSVN